MTTEDESRVPATVNPINNTNNTKAVNILRRLSVSTVVLKNFKYVSSHFFHFIKLIEYSVNIFTPFHVFFHSF